MAVILGKRGFFIENLNNEFHLLTISFDHILQQQRGISTPFEKPLVNTHYGNHTQHYARPAFRFYEAF
jgi:hypothetical protein